jgi:two-component system sensor histidine kinase KdpD
MGGSLDVEDTPGGGTTMLLTLPAAATFPAETVPADPVPTDGGETE